MNDIPPFLMTSHYILIDKKPVPCKDLMTWGRRNEGKHRVVKQEKVGIYWVSTVFLGIDHSFVEGPPLLFETMMTKKGEFEDYQTRCSTWEEAEAMHKEALKQVAELEGE